MTEDLTPVEKGKKPKAAKAPKEAKESSGSIVTRFRNWLSDSYNGLFKILIQPQLPKPRVLGFMLGAFLFGLIWAYMLAPVVFYNGSPSQLSPGQRDQYVKLVAGSYQAGLYDDSQTIQLLSRVEEPTAAIDRMLPNESGSVAASLQSVRPLAEQAGDGTRAARDGGIIRSIIVFVVAVIAFVLIVNIFALLWGLLIGGFVQRFLARLRPKTQADLDAMQTIEGIKRRKELEIQMRAEAPASDAEGAAYGPPIMQRISTYTKGRQFDDSFAIEDANDMFLGESGATISKTVGDSQELAAVEIWLFDKEDFVRTLNKVFVSEHAYNDPVSRSELDSKVDNPSTDLVVVKPGSVIVIETDAIKLQAKIVDVTYGTNPDLPPNSYFDGLTIRMEAWEKGKAGAVAPAPVSAPAYAIPSPVTTPMPAYTPPAAPAAAPPPMPSYSPPPMPSYAPQPAAPFGQRPAAPPPATLPGQADDDPFGGTGDFTPIGS